MTKSKRLALPIILMGLVCFNPACLLHADDTPPEPLVDVHITTIERMNLRSELTFYGMIIPARADKAHPAASARVAANTAGRIVAVPAVEGSTVRRNEVLVRLDSRQADATVRQAEARLKLANAVFERQQKLARLEDTSRKNLEEAEHQLAAARAALKDARIGREYLDIRSPLDGIALRVNVRTGESVLPGTVVAEIQNVDRLVAEVRIPAGQLATLETGQEAEIRTTGSSSSGRIDFVGRNVDPATGTAAARISLPSGSGMYSGQFAEAKVVVEQHVGLVVPVSAIRYQPDGMGLVAVVSNDRVRLQKVEPGIENDDFVEIAGDGIREGLRIVTLESYGLPDNARVRIIE